MKTSYESDVVAWAKEQAALIRAGQFDQLDLTHIAEEIEDVGKRGRFRKRKKSYAKPSFHPPASSGMTLAVSVWGMP